VLGRRSVINIGNPVQFESHEPSNQDPTSGDPRAGAARERLLQAAIRLVGEQGVSGVSLRGIGAAAGQKNKSAVAYHFEGKAGLMNAIAGELHDFIAPRVDALFGELESRPKETISLFEIALAVTAPLFALYLSKPRGEFSIKTLAKFTHERPEGVDEAYWDALQTMFARAVALVVQIRPKKQPGQVSFHVAHVLMATVNGLATLPNWPPGDFREDPELMFEMLLSFADYVAGGLGADDSRRPTIDVAYWKDASTP
jgi:AcrR family transcriptional regulator